MTTEKRHEDEALESLFKAARDTAPAPSTDFLARLSSDAEKAAEANQPRRSTPSPRLAGRRWFALSRLVPVGGLTASALLGLWIGSVLPSADTPLTWLSASEDADLSSFMPSSGFVALMEGGDL